MSTKFDVLQSLVKIADTVIVGGGIANTFVAIDNNVGKSLYEPDFVEAAGLRDQYGIPVPTDSRVGTEFSETAPATVKKVSEVADNEEIMDFGDETAQNMAKLLKEAKPFCGTVRLACLSSRTSVRAPKSLPTLSQTATRSLLPAAVIPSAAIDLFGIEDKISYISTGGGAFLEFVEGKTAGSCHAGRAREAVILGQRFGAV